MNTLQPDAWAEGNAVSTSRRLQRPERAGLIRIGLGVGQVAQSTLLLFDEHTAAGQQLHQPGDEPPQDEVFGRINHLMHLTRDEDERGLVLSVAAFAEDCLCKLLLAYLRDCKASSDLVEGFNAPLGTFSARIKAAFAIGILSQEQFTDPLACSWSNQLSRTGQLRGRPRRNQPGPSLLPAMPSPTCHTFVNPCDCR